MSLRLALKGVVDRELAAGEVKPHTSILIPVSQANLNRAQGGDGRRGEERGGEGRREGKEREGEHERDTYMQKLQDNSSL